MPRRASPLTLAVALQWQRRRYTVGTLALTVPVLVPVMQQCHSLHWQAGSGTVPVPHWQSADSDRHRDGPSVAASGSLSGSGSANLKAPACPCQCQWLRLRLRVGSPGLRLALRVTGTRLTGSLRLSLAVESGDVCRRPRV